MAGVPSQRASKNETWMPRLSQWLSDKVFSWIVLARLGQSRAVQSFNVFFVAVPPAQMLLSELPPVVRLTVFGQDLPIATDLPFRIALFYACAVCFAIANAVYWVCCPWFTKQFRDYGEFSQRDGSFESLKHHLCDGRAAGSEKDRRKLAADIANRFCVNRSGGKVISEADTDAWRSAFISSDCAPAQLADVFSSVQKFSADRRVLARLICAVFYILGFMILAWVLIENMSAVFVNRP